MKRLFDERRNMTPLLFTNKTNKIDYQLSCCALRRTRQASGYRLWVIEFCFCNRLPHKNWFRLHLCHTNQRENSLWKNGLAAILHISRKMISLSDNNICSFVKSHSQLLHKLKIRISLKRVNTACFITEMLVSRWHTPITEWAECACKTGENSLEIWKTRSECAEHIVLHQTGLLFVNCGREHMCAAACVSNQWFYGETEHKLTRCFINTTFASDSKMYASV